jgi:CSLREA domain-containing protein
MRYLLSLFMVGLLGTFSFAQAATFEVTNTSDEAANGICDVAGNGDGCTLREAIMAANAAAGDDSITFRRGVTGLISLTNTLPTLSSNIHLQGPGIRALKISNDTFAFGVNRIFTIASAPGTSAKPTVSISGLTLDSGYARGESFPQNSGGVIFNVGAHLTIKNCFLRGYTNGGNGGGIYNQAGTLVVNNSTVLGLAQAGGAVYNTGSALLLNSTLQGNGVTGGSVYNKGGTVSLQSCTVTGSANEKGGGVYQQGGTLAISNCTFDGNYAGSSPEGLGGALFLAGGSATVLNSTFSNNYASRGAGIYNNGGTLRLANTILTVNDFYNEGLTSLFNNSGAFISQGYNLSSDGGSGLLNGPGDQINKDPKLGPLQNNGGPTQTRALSSSSPALDAGDPTFSPPPSFDQRGAQFPRVQNGRLDIGAVEMNDVFQSGPHFEVNVKEDSNDGACGVVHCSLREAVAAANENEDHSIIGFDSTVFAPETGPHVIKLTSIGDTQEGFSALLLSANTDIQGPGAEVLTIERFSGGNYRIFRIGHPWGDVHEKDGLTVTLSGLTLRNGTFDETSNDGAGAALRSYRGVVTINNCIIKDNAGEVALSCPIGTLNINNSKITDNKNGGLSAFGTLTIQDSEISRNQWGGIRCGGTTTITNCTISDNHNRDGGGGIYGGGTLTLTNCTFSGNSAINPLYPNASGGALSGAGPVNIKRCLFRDNRADVGGAVHARATDGVIQTIAYSTFRGNKAEMGGAIRVDGGTLLINHSALYDNQATGVGGAIFNARFLRIADSTLSRNQAEKGGAIFTSFKILTILRSTFSDNSATTGGGIFQSTNNGFTKENTVNLSNSILKRGAAGANLFSDGGTFASGGYNLSDDDGAGLLKGPGDRTNLNPLLGSLQDNGGPTLTHALLSNSPALNAGNPAFTSADFDQRGPGFPRVQSGRLDIGAYESGQNLLSVSDVSIIEGDRGHPNAVFTIQLSKVSAQNVKVRCTSQGKTAIDDRDFTDVTTVVTIPAGQTSATVSVPILNDLVDEDDETFQCVLYAPEGAIIADNIGIATIVDDDRAPSLSINDLSVGEGGQARFIVTLSAPSERLISLTVATKDGVARSGLDYETTERRVLFARGQTSQTFDVQIVADARNEADENFYALLSASINASIGRGRGQCLIMDDDDSQ